MKTQLRLISPKPLPLNRKAVLEVRGVSKVFRMGDSFLDVLESIDIKADTGEFVCLLGPSGCGKSTLLKIISGFIPPSAGSVMLNSRKVSRPGPDRCVIFQEDALFPWLTVAENIAFGLKGQTGNRKIIQDETERFLSLVGLGPFRDYLPHEISGGMKQRVALARVLILKPQVLLMDEPFAALDAQTREEMQNLLLALWKQLSHTVLFVTHDVSEAVTLADRILLMDRNPGRIREDIAVNLKRPRKREDETFHRFCRRIYEQLRL